MRAFLVGVVVVVGGCDLYLTPSHDVDAGRPGSGTPDASRVLPDAAPPTVADVYQQAIQVDCDNAFRCRDSFPYPDQFTSTFGTSPSDCVAKLEPSVVQTEQQVEAAVAAGRIVYHPADAEACLAFVEGETCSDFWSSSTPLPSVCRTAFQGTVASQGACTISLDCATSGSQCTGTPMVCTP